MRKPIEMENYSKWLSRLCNCYAKVYLYLITLVNEKNIWVYMYKWIHKNNVYKAKIYQNVLKYLIMSFGRWSSNWSITCCILWSWKLQIDFGFSLVPYTCVMRVGGNSEKEWQRNDFSGENWENMKNLLIAESLWTFEWKFLSGNMQSLQ